MSKKRLISLASVAALATFSVTPAAAQAGPRWRLNGVLTPLNQTENILQFGTITMKSPFLGEIKCNVFDGAPIRNESERGVASVDGWETSDCRMPECLRGSASVMAEAPPKLVEVVREVAERGAKTLPWPAELTAPEGRTSLRIGNTEKVHLAPIKFWVNCPGEGLEVPYEGELVPAYVNGSKNGLKPSHLEFEGSGGKTGHLLTPDICGGECEQADLFLNGSLTTVGTNQQLVAAE
jgi:hypothetical protein